MGSKTPHHENDQGHDGPSSDGSICVGGQQKGSHVSRDGDGCMGSNGAASDSDDDDDDEKTASVSLTVPKKNRKRKSRKSKNKKKPTQQTSPPRVALDNLLPSGNYPEGELLEYTPARLRPSDLNSERGTTEDEKFLKDYRKAAEVHRQTRKWVLDTISPGQSLTDIAIGIEDSVRALLNNSGLDPGSCRLSGMGFPTGLSLNNCVAHWTPNPGQKDIVLQHEDVVKVDFGVHINGWIVDSAFTVAFDPTYDNLLAAVKDATNTGIKTAGVDVRISDVSAAIQEAMESYEVEIRGKMFPVKAVRNITGHNIKQYRIHAGKSIPFVKNSDQTKMEAGEVFAIETFGTTGRGWLTDGPGIYGYGLDYNAPTRVALPLASANRVYKTIKENFGSIVFCRRYLERLGVERYLAGVNSLVSNGLLERYAPLMDVSGSYSAQFEHTILLREEKKEVISRGDDY